MEQSRAVGCGDGARRTAGLAAAPRRAASEPKYDAALTPTCLQVIVCKITYTYSWPCRTLLVAYGFHATTLFLLNFHLHQLFVCILPT